MAVLQARILEWVACLPPGELPNPGIEPGSPVLQVDSLPAELLQMPLKTNKGLVLSNSCNLEIQTNNKW